MIFSLKGKRILVTGGSSGIGRQIAIDAAAMGASVTIVARNKDKLADVAAELVGEGHQYFMVDLTNENNLVDFIKNTVPFDGVVFNAGIVEYAPVKFLSAEKIKKIFDTNYNSGVILSQQLIKNKLVNKKGSLVFISSVASKIGVAGTALYASSKAALSAYTRVIASELAPQGTRANSISPGIIITPMTKEATSLTTDEIDEKEKAYPLGYGKPEDVSALAIYLLSDVSRWMTGSDLVIDGGLTLF